MSISFKKVLIISKKDNKAATNLAIQQSNWFRERGIESFIGTISNLEQEVADFKPELALVLGGDGTVLYVARKLIKQNLYFLGVNFGRVGFLAEIHPDKWEDLFEEIFLKNSFSVSERLAIKCKVYRSNWVFFSGHSVNDVVICREGLARLLDITLFIGENEEALNIRADGIIVSTPNGSTGYCVGAGGSLIFPELNVLEICPICPFLSLIKPMIVASDRVIEIELNGSVQDATLTIDGQEGFKLQKKDRVVITKSPYSLKFITPYRSSYIKKLKQKGYV